MKIIKTKLESYKFLIKYLTIDRVREIIDQKLIGNSTMEKDPVKYYKKFKKI